MHLIVNLHIPFSEVGHSECSEGFHMEGQNLILFFSSGIPQLRQTRLFALTMLPWCSSWRGSTEN